jgi:phosphohistidine phosphatase
MELILWRHAEAEDTTPDMERKLTGRGRKQASRMADWLNPRLPPDIRVLASPATRAWQTAQALGRDYELVPELAPNASAADLLRVANWPDSSYPVLIVGHQPTLGQVAMQLLANRDGDLPVKKSGIWWFVSRERAGELQVVLRAVAGPDWL